MKRRSGMGRRSVRASGTVCVARGCCSGTTWAMVTEMETSMARMSESESASETLTDHVDGRGVGTRSR